MASGELGEVGFWTLTSLANGRLHGYAIMREAEDAAGEKLALKATTLYAALDRLAREGLVAVDGEEVVAGRARRYFRLTDKGLERLRIETDQLEARAKVARGRLSSRPALGGAST